MTATTTTYQAMVANPTLTSNERVVSVAPWTSPPDDADCTRRPHQRRRKTVVRNTNAGTVTAPFEIRECSEQHWASLPNDGIFRLNDFGDRLPVAGFKLKRLASELEKPWSHMGVAIFKGEWLVHLATFKNWYTRQVLLIRHVPATWDANYMLKQEGIFYLKEVCSKLPF